MNKKTFAIWGGIIATVIVLAIIITFATPFGAAVRRGVKGFLEGFNEAGEQNGIEQIAVSTDVQTAKQINAVIRAANEGNAPLTVAEAKELLKANGIDADKITTSSDDRIFYWDSSENCVILYDQAAMKVISPDEQAQKYAGLQSGNRSADWYILNEQTPEVIPLSETATAEDLREAVKNAKQYQVIKIQNDYNISSVDLYKFGFPQSESGTTRLDLNGHIITCDTYYKNIEVAVNDSLYISNGTIETSDSYASASQYASMSVKDGATLVLENVTFKTETSAGIFPAGTASEVRLINSTVECKGLTLATNASGNASNHVVINVENSTIRSTESIGMQINVACEVYIANSVIEGDSVGVCLRTGTAYFENSTIRENAKDDSWFTEKYGELSTSDIGWGSGTQVQWGSLIIGDWKENAYSTDANCVLVNTVVEAVSPDLPTVYISQDGDNTASLVYDSSCRIGMVQVNSATNLNRGKIVINGKEE